MRQSTCRYDLIKAVMELGFAAVLIILLSLNTQKQDVTMKNNTAL